jgi:prepilin-type processing-associated H-X9-DG protein
MLTYAYNGKLNYTKLARFGNVASKIAIGDVPVHHADRTPSGYVENWFIWVRNDSQWRQYGWWSDIHNGGGNYGYIDGHAKWLGESDPALGPVVPTGGPYLSGDQTGSWFPDN